MSIEQRIKTLRNELGLNQTDFAEKIGIKQAGISAIEKGIRGVTDRNIILICEKFNVNEEWLRNGTGEIFIAAPLEDELSAFLGDILGGDDEFIKKYIISYMRLKEEQKQVLRNFIKSLAKQDENE